MVDRHYTEASLAELYDRFSEPRADFDFYLPLIMSANAVLDVGCGTGALLHRARKAGHTGRLTGLDPAAGMLDVAKRRASDIEWVIEWVLGDLASVDWDQEFDLVVMTGHAFQVLLVDDDIRSSLAAIRSALVEGGRFAFETRNPMAREWERWTVDDAVEVIDDDGAVVRWERVVEAVEGDLVTFTQTYTSPNWVRPQISRSTLKFLDADALATLLSDAGFAIEDQFGDWDRQPLTDSSLEIITIARWG